MQRHRIKFKGGLLAIIVLISVAISAVGYRLMFWVDSYPPYTLEQVLRNTKKLSNQPLVRKLFDLGAKVGGIKDKKPGAIKGEPQRDNLVFLTKICKDSCRAIRCRMDPGLGHACRINCPKKTVRFCSIAVKPLPEEVKK
jgi:hypothetical protein